MKTPLLMGKAIRCWGSLIWFGREVAAWAGGGGSEEVGNAGKC